MGHPTLESFIDSLQDWLAVVPSGSLFYERIEFTKCIYADRTFAKKELFRLKVAARDDSILIYQLRNRIVHSAYVDTKGTAYFVERAQKFAKLLLKAVIADSDNRIGRAVARAVAAADRLLLRLEIDDQFTLLANDQ